MYDNREDTLKLRWNKQWKGWLEPAKNVLSNIESLVLSSWGVSLSIDIVKSNLVSILLLTQKLNRVKWGVVAEAQALLLVLKGI